MQTPFDEIGSTLPCKCFNDRRSCLCQDGERALHHYAAKNTLPPMTPEQRAWCLAEVRSVEGMDSETRELEDGADDNTYAHYTLRAWIEYCRDKGLI